MQKPEIPGEKMYRTAEEQARMRTARGRNSEGLRQRGAAAPAARAAPTLRHVLGQTDQVTAPKRERRTLRYGPTGSSGLAQMLGV